MHTITINHVRLNLIVLRTVLSTVAIGVSALAIWTIPSTISFISVIGILLFGVAILRKNPVEKYLLLVISIIPIVVHAVPNIIWAILILFPPLFFKLLERKKTTILSMLILCWRPFILLGLATLVSLIFAIDYTAATRILGYHIVFIIVAVLLTDTIRNEANLNRLTDALAISVIASSIIAIYQCVFGLNALEFYPGLNPNVGFMGILRVPGPFINSLTFSHFLGIWLAFLSGVVLEKGKIQGMQFVALLVGIPTLLLTISRMAIISFFLSFILAAILSHRSRLAIFVVVLGLLSAVIYTIFQIAPQEMEIRFLQLFSNAELKRISLWLQSLTMLEEYPLGVGLGNYSSYANEFVSFSLIEFEVAEGSILYRTVRAHPENAYLTILLEIGYFGLIAVIWLLAKLFVYGFRLYYTGNNNIYRKFAVGIICAWTMIALNGITTYNYLDKRTIGQTWILLGVTLAAENIRRRKDIKIITRKKTK